MRFQTFVDRDQALARIKSIASGGIVDAIQLFKAVNDHPPYTLDDIALAEQLRKKISQSSFPYNAKIVGNGAKLYVATQAILQLDRIEQQIDLYLQHNRFGGSVPLILADKYHRYVQDGHHRIAAAYALRTPLPIYFTTF